MAGLVGTIILGVARGELSAITFKSLALNGAGGFGITFLGSYLINLLRAPCLLDRLSQQRIQELEAEHPYIVSRPYPKNLGNAALRKHGLDIARGIKDLYLREADYQSDWLYKTPDLSGTQAQRVQQSQESYRQYEKGRQTIQAVYWKDYQTNAILLRDEMRTRLGGLPAKKTHGFEVQYEVGQAGGFRVQDIASELEWLALQIPANRLLQ